MATGYFGLSEGRFREPYVFSNLLKVRWLYTHFNLLHGYK